ncbi:MAG: hypothetical protein HPY55_16260 [Firmicutes bacterium]|nr:hypothetical protein [Bacillota bacterium]
MSSRPRRSIVALLCIALSLTLLMPTAGAQDKGQVGEIGWIGPLTGGQAVRGQCEFNTVKMLV